MSRGDNCCVFRTSLNFNPCRVSLCWQSLLPTEVAAECVRTASRSEVLCVQRRYSAGVTCHRWLFGFLPPFSGLHPSLSIPTSEPWRQRGIFIRTAANQRVLFFSSVAQPHPQTEQITQRPWERVERWIPNVSENVFSSMSDLYPLDTVKNK